MDLWCNGSLLDGKLWGAVMDLRKPTLRIAQRHRCGFTTGISGRSGYCNIFTTSYATVALGYRYRFTTTHVTGHPGVPIWIYNNLRDESPCATVMDLRQPT